MKKLTFKRLNKIIDDLKETIKDMGTHMAELQNYNDRAGRDIKAYNKVIDDMIAGKSPCPMCEEYMTCQNKKKDKKGCEDWMLTWAVQENVGKEAGENDESESVPGESAEGREGTTGSEAEG